jgi:CheY-like chemotaxis protein
MMPVAGTDPILASGESLRGQPGPAWDAHEIVEPRGSRPRVLVVDDQRLIADSLVEILRNAGFEAAAAYDGWEALGVASQFSPDCVLSDVLMPRMNGVELAIAIRNKYPATTILLFSGQAGISEILQEGQSRGYQFELIPKPIHPLRLIERLRSG